MLHRHAVPGSGDEGTGSRGELRDQAGAGGGEAAVQHGQRESGESTRHHQRAAATEGETAAHRQQQTDTTGKLYAHAERLSLEAEEVNQHFFFLNRTIFR